MQIYSSSSQSLVSLFEPLPPTQPTPTNSQTGKFPTSSTLQPPSSTSSSSTTTDPNAPTNPNNPGGDVNYRSSSKRTVAIGASLGAFAFLVILSGTAYYLRRRHRRQGDVRFMVLGDDERGDGADSLHFDGEIPAVSTRGDPFGSVYGGNRRLLSSLGFAGATTKMGNVRNTYQRRDMLDDEDTRSFGEWYASRGRDGTGESSWSLKSILGGGARLVSREASTGSRGTNTGGRNTPWREKSDAFADGTSLLRDEGTGFSDAVSTSGPTRPHAIGRLMSQASSKSGRSYKDPFSDSIQEERRQRSDASNPFSREEEIEDPLRFSVRHVPVLSSSITSTLPLSQGGHTLSPLSEHTNISHHTLVIPESSTATSSHAHSNETEITPFGGGSSSFGTSRTSVDPPSSFIGTVYNDMRRTDSWWTRFTRTTLLDRRLSDGSRKSSGGKFEIRDPKPPPRLDAIAENVRLGSSSQEPSPHQQGPKLGRAESMAYGMGHGKSMSSLRTADSEAIERMAGTMDVSQRLKTRSNSNRTMRSIDSTGGVSIDTVGSSVDSGHDNYVIRGGRTSQGILLDDLLMFSSPVEILPLPAPGGYNALESSPPRVSSSPPLLSVPSPVSIRPITSPSPLLLKSTPTSPSSPSVADRIHAFEKRMSLELPAMNNAKYPKKKRATVDYGLVPRASLFVANPDSYHHRLSTSSGVS